MNKIMKLMLSLLLASWAASVTPAQDRRNVRPAPSVSTVTISTTDRGMRFTALGGAKQVRLEVFSQGGDSLYGSGFQAGSVLDWALDDSRGQRLPDGTYVCVITVRDLSGRLFVKQGAIQVQGGQGWSQMAEADQAGPAEPDETLAPVTNDATAVTFTAHDGRDGQVVSTRGALSFRAGDFFAGREKELMRLTPDGDVGVGVTAPTAKLDVAGTIRARGGIQFDDGTVLSSAGRGSKGVTAGDVSTKDDVTAAAVSGTGTANKMAKWFDGAGTLGDSAVTEAGGKLGVGTPTPNYEFTLFGNDVGLQLISPGTGSTPGDGFRFGIDSTNKAFLWNQEATDLYFGTGAVERMRVAAGGNVGIGTKSPSAKLDVAGDLKVSGDAVVAGNIAAKYQDVAEWVGARGPLAAGTVVILDRARPNTVRASARPYDTQVAGVVSARPGVILGEAGEGKVMVATTGRVKVRVDATRRPVRIGDLLVTGERAGVAMRSLPIRAGRARIHRPGTILGKALEPLANGEGEILVLLSLQ